MRLLPSQRLLLYTLSVIFAGISLFFVFYTVRLLTVTHGLRVTRPGGQGAYVGAIVFPLLAAGCAWVSWRMAKRGRHATLRIIASIALLVAPLASCDHGAAEPVAGSTRTVLTDDPFPYSRVARVDLYVVSVSASVSPDTSAGATSFVTLATPNRRINVLALQRGLTDELGSASVPAGAITAVRLVIDTDLSSITLKSGAVLTGSSTPGIHWQSSAGRPVLNALLHEQILVPDSGAVVVIDYDVGKAFITPQEINPASTDSGFVFSPVLHAADAARTGSIAGTVHAHDANGAAVESASLRLYLGKPSSPENTWSVLGTATTDATGAFRFAYVTRSSYWASLAAHAGESYIVAVDPPAGSGLGRALVPNLAVTAGTERTVGTVVLP